MSAWIFALVCLFHSGTCPNRPPSPSTTLFVYLTVNQAQPAAPVEAMKRELTPLLQDAGLRIVWQDPARPDPASLASNLAMLELRGVCALPPGADRIEPEVGSGASLAETVVSAEGVTPFSRVNCANLTRMIGPALSDEAMALRDQLYGRAMARVVAHEFYHVLMGSRDHGRSGVAKPSFTVNDLLDEVFRFDAADVARLHRKTMPGDTAPDLSVGR